MADLKVDINNQFQRVKPTAIVISNAQDMTDIDIQATVGNLTVLYGDKVQIEIGPQIFDHASFSYDGGTLIYRDDFEENDLSFDDINSENIK